MPNTRGYRVATGDDGPNVPLFIERLAEDVANDVDGVVLGLEEVSNRVPQMVSAPGLLVAFIDALRRRTWLEANDIDGGPTSHAIARLRAALGLEGWGRTLVPGVLVAITDALKTRTWLEANDTNGGPTPHSIKMLLQALTPALAKAGSLASDTYVHYTGEVRPLAHDMTRVSMWSSSSGDYGAPYYSAMFGALGATYFNFGKYGERVEHIAARLGSRPAIVTVSGGTVPASGPVAVTASNMAYTTLVKSYTGTLAGIPGTLAVDSGAGTFAFTRTTAGSATAVPADTPFIPTEGPAHRADVTALWMGKNNMDLGPGQDTNVITITDQAHDWIAPLAKRVLVLGHFVDGGTGAVSATRDRIYAVNAAHKARYGDRFVDIHAFTVGPDIWTLSGVTPTQADLDAQAIGNKPPSLSADGAHYNAAGYQAVTTYLQTRVKSLGWY